MKIILAFSLVIFSLVFAGGCRKEEQRPMVQAQQMPAGHGLSAAKSEVKVVVPDKIKARWTAVKLIVNDKVNGKKYEFTPRPDTELDIKDTNLKVLIGAFLPDFTMDAGTITSATDEPNNPAVAIRVMEGDKQLFPVADKQWGWLFSKFPAIHPFEHQRYGIVLKEGLEK